MILYTIGFTQTTAEVFFGKLRAAGVTMVMDTRIKRDGQLSGFAKVPDFQYFLERLADSGYKSVPSLAPTVAMLKAYKGKLLSWDEYAQLYRQLLRERQPEQAMHLAALDRACLLCSELAPQKCHRRLAAEYLRETLGDRAAVEIVHL